MLSGEGMRGSDTREEDICMCTALSLLSFIHFEDVEVGRMPLFYFSFCIGCFTFHIALCWHRLDYFVHHSHIIAKKVELWFGCAFTVWNLDKAKRVNPHLAESESAISFAGDYSVFQLPMKNNMKDNTKISEERKKIHKWDQRKGQSRVRDGPARK